MANYVALLRAVNVGGTGKLPMSDLKELSERAGCRKVRTYIAIESQESNARGSGSSEAWNRFRRNA